MTFVYLIIPIFNGEAHVENTCRKLAHICREQQLFSHIVFVNDGSHDKTGVYIETYSQDIDAEVDIYTYEKNRGKGFALKYGISHSDIKDDDIVVFTDVDIPYGFDVIRQVITMLAQDTRLDMVVGNRKHHLTNTTQYTKYRALAHHVFRMCMPSQLRSIPDTQCGMKVFRGHVAGVLFSSLKTFRWVFDIELFLLAQKHGYTMKDIAVIIEKESLEARSSLSFLKHALSVFRDLLVIYRTY